jgi:uncharacterized phiE125 gp8 family phage protein
MSIDWTYWPSSPYWNDSFADYRPPWVTPSRPTTIRWESAQTLAPTDFPVSVAMAKNYAKIDVGDDDELVEFFLGAATARVEAETSLSCLTQTWQLLLDRWPGQGRVEYWPEPSPRLGDILLPRWPVQSITSFVFTDQTGAPNTVATSVYGFDPASQPARVYLKYGQSWPSSPALAGGPAIVGTFVAGYGATASTVDYRARLAILRIFKHYYDNRDDIVVDQRIRSVEVPKGAQDLMDQLTVGAMVA